MEVALQSNVADVDKEELHLAKSGTCALALTATVRFWNILVVVERPG
jgi:hypothetical protein